MDDRKAAVQPSEIRFDSPEGDDKARLDAILLADLGEKLVVFLEASLALIDACLGHNARQILLEGQREFRLLAVEFDNTRNRREPLERAVERFGTDAFAERVGPQALEPAGKVLIGGITNAGNGDGKQGGE